MESKDGLYEAVLRELRLLNERLKPELRLLKPGDAALALNCSERQLARFKVLGLINTVQLGDQWRVSTMEIARIAAEGIPSLTRAPAPKSEKTGSAGAATVRAALRLAKKQPA